MKKPVSVLWVLAVLSIFSCGSPPAAAQYPRPARAPISLLDLGKHLKSTRFSRIVVVDSGGGGDYKKLSEALAFVAKRNSSERNWTSRWTVLVYPGRGGSSDPDAYGFNYSEASLTVPAYTEVLGVTTGANNPVGWMGATPIIELRATSGPLIRLGGGSSLTNLQFFWAQTPTAAVKALDHTTVPDNDPKNYNLSYPAELTNVSFSLISQGTAFPVDGITESTGGLSIYGGGVILDGSPAGRNVVNAGTDPMLGISIYGGRYASSPGCAALIANTAAGPLRLFAGVRLETRCTNDLLRSGTGPIEVQGGIGYGPASGVITHGPLHLPFGTTNPATCSPGAAFVNTTSGAPKLCACTATDTWRCAPLP